LSDDDDWTGGEPPEGRHTRAQSNPDFWRNQWQPVAIGGTVVLVLAIILLVVLLV
jgi:hypothetical protein